ncbi:MAG: hypothetical protein HQK52_01605 [Oligoflexia bacterium]|nr:hypothetical protein [Oligoflexia bacterium]
MFLIKTALTRYWQEQEEDPLFLGQWCLNFENREHALLSKKHAILDYHWDDKKKLERDYCYLNKLTQKVLEQLRDNLNSMKGNQYPVRHYEIIFGFWLRMYLSVIFDRYACLMLASQRYKISGTLISTYREDEFIADNIYYLFDQYPSDEYNHYLYSKIISMTDILPYQVSNEQKKIDIAQVKNSFAKRAGFRSNALFWKFLIKKYLRFLHKKNRVFLSSLLKDTKEENDFLLKMKERPFFFGFPSKGFLHFQYDSSLRKKLIFDLGEGDFEKLLNKLLPMQLPINYLEGYDKTGVLCREVYPENIKVFVASSAIYSNEYFARFVADKVCDGAKLICSQYGGGYGVLKYTAFQDYELSICDHYFSWGWCGQEKDRHKIIPNPSILINKEKITPQVNGYILSALFEQPRYSYEILSFPISASGGKRSFRLLSDFLSLLPASIRNRMLIRPPLYNFGQNQRGMLQEQFPDIALCENKKSFRERLSESCLFIGTYNSTAFLETLGMNYPTLVFFNTKEWELSEEAIPYFDLLTDAGILYADPMEIAQELSRIIEDVSLWWNHEKRQVAVAAFIEKFAKNDEKWKDTWVKAISAIG